MRTLRAAALAAAALLLPGCYAARSAFPTDASGMEYPARWASRTFRDQTRRTADNVTGLPSALGRHFAECWRNATVDPRDVPK